MRARVFLHPMVLLVVCASVLNANTILVPSGNHSTIQEGIDAAVDGDTVLVADGIYTGDGNRDIDFLGKAIVVMSENGPENCIIDCNGSFADPHRGFDFHTDEDSLSVVQGFTITNGNAGPMPLISQGGGLRCYSSSPTIRGNIITNCFAYTGGGIYTWASSTWIVDNLIKDNTSREGGGIDCKRGSSARIIDNTVIWNGATLWGGGIRCSHSTATVSGNVIYGNSAYYGGGVYSNDDPASTIINNTIIENTASYGGSGIMINLSSPSVLNCVVRDNTFDEICLRLNSNPTIQFCNVAGGWAGEGNIDAEPLFVLPDKRDYRLLWESPCIDTGHPDYLDPDGTRSDMGAHYFNQDDYLTLYMTPDTTEVAQGGQTGVTYTIINRWQQKEPFSALTRVTLPDGEVRTVLGPEDYDICPGYTAQIHLTYDIPQCAYVGMYEYKALIGLPPSTLYDRDSFRFTVIE